MQRKSIKISLNKLSHSFSQKLLVWAQQYETFAWLDSNNVQQPYNTFEKVLAVGVVSELEANAGMAFQRLKDYQNTTKDFLFGYLGYDLKNEIEPLHSLHIDGLQFPDLYFFQPQKLFLFYQNILEIQYHPSCADTWEKDENDIEQMTWEDQWELSAIDIKQRISHADYIRKCQEVKEYIKWGNTYETNLCMEFYAEGVTLKPLQVFKELNALSQTPFAVFFRHRHHYMLSASPERFVKKEGLKLITQPIKGTIKRSANPATDLALKKQLEQNPKDRSENIMIVDLVRNDLSKTATTGSVSVEELCKVYTFPSVHQMISTVTAQVKPETDATDIIKSLFPMGSMTGAPKIATMELIEKVEASKRGLYSGAFGYFTPQSDFDFNVVIRSILYHAAHQYLSFSVGGAITAASEANHEYEECLLKAANIRNTLSKFFTETKNN